MPNASTLNAPPVPLVLILEREERRPSLLAILERFECRVECFDHITPFVSYGRQRRPALAIIARAVENSPYTQREMTKLDVPVVCLFEREQGTTRPGLAWLKRTPLDAAGLVRIGGDHLVKRLRAEAPHGPGVPATREEATARYWAADGLVKAASARHYDVTIALRQADRAWTDSRRELDDLLDQRDAQKALALRFYDNERALEAMLPADPTSPPSSGYGGQGGWTPGAV